MSGRQGHRSRNEEEADCATRQIPAPTTDDGAVSSAESHTPVDMLRKMLLVKPNYFEQLRRSDDDTGARNDMRSLLQKKGAHSYER